MLAASRRFLGHAAGRSDLVLVVLMMTVIFMIIIPLPTIAIDVLIGLNLALTVLIIVVTIYLEEPVKFSTLPSVLLFSTLFRLAISISTTRLILVQADAGEIVETFGNFVVGGNVIVGMVVFLIITVVQFVVVTKGAERVAEVSARFSLDALPGKQMSIDSDMRAGEITLDEARRRREVLQTESEFYGSMDGAMKFVKGDAIAGLIIIFVNLIGGIAVGVIQLDMSMDEASARFSVLTVGDGLVAQIPALLTAIAAGLVVTRVRADKENSRDLGSDIARQIGGNPAVLQIAAGVLVLFALIPGFPTAVFLALAGIFGVSGWLIRRKTAAKPASDSRRLPDDEGLRQDLALTPMSPVYLGLGAGLYAALDRDAFKMQALVERTQRFEALGIPFPPIQPVREDGPDDRWRLLIENVPVIEGTMPPGRVVIRDDPEHVAVLGLPVETAQMAPGRPPSALVPAEHAPALSRAGVAFATAEQALAGLAGAELPRHASDFIGVQETRNILMSMESRYDELVREAQKTVPIQRIAEVLRRLIEEEISVRNMRIVLEAFVEWGAQEKDPQLLAEYARTALARQISHRYADESRLIPAYVIESDIEKLLRDSIRHSTHGSFLALDPDRARKLIDRIKAAVGNLSEHRSTPVVLVGMDVRRFLRRFLVENGIDLPTLSHREIAQNYKIHPLAMVTLS